jgi:hypothetical protein
LRRGGDRGSGGDIGQDTGCYRHLFLLLISRLLFLLLICINLLVTLFFFFFFGISEVRRVSNPGGQLGWQRRSSTLPSWHKTLGQRYSGFEGRWSPCGAWRTSSRPLQPERPLGNCDGLCTRFHPGRGPQRDGFKGLILQVAQRGAPVVHTSSIHSLGGDNILALLFGQLCIQLLLELLLVVLLHIVGGKVKSFTDYVEEAREDIVDVRPWFCSPVTLLQITAPQHVHPVLCFVVSLRSPRCV